MVRTSVDPYQGRLSILRVFSGTLTPETAVHVSGHGGGDRGHPDHDTDERVGQIFSPLGATLRPVDQAIAGDICAVGRLGTAETGDTLSAKAEPLLIEAWDLPQPQLPIAVEAATRGDEDALAKALARLTAGDPTVRVERDRRAPTSSSCGAWARRMRTSCWSGCARPARTSTPCRCGSRCARRSRRRRAGTAGW